LNNSAELSVLITEPLKREYTQRPASAITMSDDEMTNRLFINIKT